MIRGVLFYEIWTKRRIGRLGVRKEDLSWSVLHSASCHLACTDAGNLRNHGRIRYHRDAEACCSELGPGAEKQLPTERGLVASRC